MCTIQCEYHTHNLNMWVASNAWIELNEAIGNGLTTLYAKNKNLKIAHEYSYIRNARK